MLAWWLINWVAMQFFTSVYSSESRLGWLHNIGLSVKRFLRQFLGLFNNFFFKLKITLRPIFWPKSPYLKKIIDLKVYCNLNLRCTTSKKIPLAWLQLHLEANVMKSFLSSSSARVLHFAKNISMYTDLAISVRSLSPSKSRQDLSEIQKESSFTERSCQSWHDVENLAANLTKIWETHKHHWEISAILKRWRKSRHDLTEAQKLTNMARSLQISARSR